MDNEANDPELNDLKIREIMPNLEETWRHIAEMLERTSVALERVELVGGYGWTIPMHSGLGKTSSLYESISDEATADTAFERYFTDCDSCNLHILTNSLLQKSELAKWKPLLIEVVDSFYSGRYRIVVSALLPVMEGVCVVTFGKLTFHKTKDRESFISEMRSWANLNESLTAFMWLSAIGLWNVLYKPTDFEQLSETDEYKLNRHVILHGRSIPCANKLDAIKLMLAIDTISALSYPSPVFRK